MKIELNKLSKDELLQMVRAQAKCQQSLTSDVIALIREVDARKLFLGLGFGSLFEFVTKDLGYEASSAQRRILAARVIAAVPEAEFKLRNGELTLSALSKAQSYFRAERKRTGESVTREEKIEVLKELENTSAREADRILISKSPDHIKVYEKERPVTEKLTEIKLVIDNELKAVLDKLKSMLAHQSPNLSYVDLIRLMAYKTEKPESQDYTFKK